ncbi:MAG: DUF427 domain-containing protein [Planctomycetota bacterium]
MKSPSPSQRETPGPGQESVWDYPRPPRLEPVGKPVRVELNGVEIARTDAGLRILETSHPPTVYIPPTDIADDVTSVNDHGSFCEWKGRAGYVDVHADGQIVENAGWFYPAPVKAYADLRDFIAFYPSKVKCYIGDEPVKAQEGDFYGGWITDNLVGPFKGGPGTWGW